MKFYLIVNDFDSNDFAVVGAVGFVPQGGILLDEWPMIDELTGLKEEKDWLQLEKENIEDEFENVIGERTILTVNQGVKDGILNQRQQEQTEAAQAKAALQAEIDFFRAEAAAWDGSTWQTREDQHRIIGYIIRCLTMLDNRTKHLDGT